MTYGEAIGIFQRARARALGLARRLGITIDERPLGLKLTRDQLTCWTVGGKMTVSADEKNVRVERRSA